MRAWIVVAALVLLPQGVATAAPTDCTPCWAIRQYPLAVTAMKKAKEKGVVANTDQCEEQARDAEKLTALLLSGEAPTGAGTIARAVVGHCAACACLEAIN